MRSGVTLAELREEVFIEAGLSTAAGHAVQMTQRVNHLLNRMERQLATRHTWPTLTTEQEVTVAADVQFTALPPLINFTKISDVWTLFGDEWLPVLYGIGAAERSLYSGAQRASPIQRWEIRYPGDADFEVWPRSASEETMRFTGERNVGMGGDMAPCLLDGDALVLMVAAELLAKSDPEMAKVKLSAADSIVRNTLNRQVGRKAQVVNLAERPSRMLREGLDYIASGRVD